MRLRKRVDRLEMAAESLEALHRRLSKTEAAVSDASSDGYKPMNYHEKELSRTLRQTMDRVFKLEVRMQQAEERLHKLENPSAVRWTNKPVEPPVGYQPVVITRFLDGSLSPVQTSDTTSDSTCKVWDQRVNYGF